MKINLSRYHNIISLLTIVLLFGGLQFLFSIFAGQDRSSGNILFQFFSLTLYSIAAFHLFKSETFLLKEFLFKNSPLILLLAWSFISFLWSIEPETSFRRAFALILSTIFCAYLSNKFTIDNALKNFWIAGVFVCFVGIFASFIPGIGTDPANWQYPDAWRGLTGNKTDFGRILAITTILTFYVYKKKEITLPIAILIIILLVSALFKSEATTPLLLTFISLFSINAFTRVAGFKKIISTYIVLFSFFFSLFFLFNLVISNFSSITESIGKDVTLTGRTYIWEYALTVSSDYRLFGSGYRCFWIDKITYDFHFYNPFWGEELMNNGHNGYIDVLVELGIVGFLLFMFFLFSYLKRMLTFISPERTLEQSLGVSIFLFYIIYSITEQVTLEQSEFLWMLLTFIYFSMSKK